MLFVKWLGNFRRKDWLILREVRNDGGRHWPHPREMSHRGRPTLAAPPRLRSPPAKPALDSDLVAGTSRSIRQEARSVDIPEAGHNRSRDRIERSSLPAVGIAIPIRCVLHGRRG